MIFHIQETNPKADIMLFASCILLLSSSVFLADAQVPGGTIGSTNLTDINQALDIILDDNDILDFTRIGVGLANEGPRALSQPKWYLHNGNTDHLMPLNIYSGTTGLNLFTKNSISLSGTQGVITYDIEGTSLCIAIMWNVPNVGSNTMNVKIYPQLSPDEDLYDQLRDVAGEWGTDETGRRTEYGITVSGSITTGWAAKQIVHINTSGYNFNLGPSLNAWCDTKLIGRDLCVRECTPIGKCDTDFSCDRDSDCNGNTLVCSGSCN